MRKSIDGLSSIVEQNFKLNPLSDAIFVFHNRHCDKIKMLYWDGDGFLLLYKRIEYGKFHFPTVIDSDKYTVTNEELNWLLHGLQIENVHKYERFKKERFSTEKNVFQYGIITDFHKKVLRWKKPDFTVFSCFYP